MQIKKYQHPLSGGSAETVGITDAGERLYINTQYGTVIRKDGTAVADCAEIIADARVRGKFGEEPVAVAADGVDAHAGHDAIIEAMTLGGKSM
jgi:hypothetical protein